jgi:hypothetical protein
MGGFFMPAFLKILLPFNLPPIQNTQPTIYITVLQTFWMGLLDRIPIKNACKNCHRYLLLK